MLQGLAGGLINPQVSGLVQQLFRSDERGRAFGVLGTTVGVGTALGPVVGGALIALGGPHIGWRLVFFVNVPIGIAVVILARRLLPADPARGKHRLDLLGAALLGAATFCVLFGAVEYDSLRDKRLAWLLVPAVLLVLMFGRRERRLTAQRRDPLIDLHLFRVPSYTSGVVLALTFFPAMAGLPLVLNLYYQQGLGYTALASGLGITAYALGSAVAAPLAGRFVTKIGRPLVVAAAMTFGLGAILLGVLASSAGSGHAALILGPALFVMGVGSGAVITPNQALTLMEVDPVSGSTAGGVLQTAQRIGLAIGQAVIGAVFFAGVHSTGSTEQRYTHGLHLAVIAALCFVAVACRRRADRPSPQPRPDDADGGRDRAQLSALLPVFVHPNPTEERPGPNAHRGDDPEEDQVDPEVAGVRMGDRERRLGDDLDEGNDRQRVQDRPADPPRLEHLIALEEPDRQHHQHRGRQTDDGEFAQRLGDDDGVPMRPRRQRQHGPGPATARR